MLPISHAWQEGSMMDLIETAPKMRRLGATRACWMGWRGWACGTLPQVGLVLAAVLPIRAFDVQLALDILAYRQQRNHAASISHRKFRIALVTQRE
jgi:hypothetical protein